MSRFSRDFPGYWVGHCPVCGGENFAEELETPLLCENTACGVTIKALENPDYTTFRVQFEVVE